jgi:lipopolysaccharide export LptBFGC system permease protein LptF
MSHYKPIHQRVNDIQRAKHASRLAEKLNRDASNPDLTFRPKINATSQLLVESRRMDTDDPDQFDVTTRLMKDANDASARSMRRQQAYLNEKAAELSFQPKISQASQEIIAHNSNYMGPEGSNFLKRQHRLQKKHEKAKARKIREAAEKSECTFKPDTGTASEVLRHTRPYRLKESSLERTERLYRQDIEAKKKKRAGAFVGNLSFFSFFHSFFFQGFRLTFSLLSLSLSLSLSRSSSSSPVNTCSPPKTVRDRVHVQTCHQ